MKFATSTSTLPKVLLVGGPDVDARIDLMDKLRTQFDVRAVGSSPLIEDKFEAAGLDYYEYSMNPGVNAASDIRMVTQLVSLFRGLRPDIVHAFDTKPGVWGCIAARLARVPVVVGTITGFGGSLQRAQGLRAQLLWRIYGRLQRVSCHASDLTIFQNHSDARECLASGITSSGKADVILGSGVATDKFDPDRASARVRNRVRDELGIAADEIVVTMISRVMRSKGVPELIEAAQATRIAHPRVRFLLVGPDDADSVGTGESLTRIEREALRASIIWAGPRSDIYDVLAASDVFTLPTAYGEGVPRSLLEAGAMRLPLVATETPGCADVVLHGETGFLVPVHDPTALTRALIRLIESDRLRRRLGAAARQHVVRKFDLSIVAERTRTTYHALLERAGGTARC